MAAAAFDNHVCIHISCGDSIIPVLVDTSSETKIRNGEIALPSFLQALKKNGLMEGVNLSDDEFNKAQLMEVQQKSSEEVDILPDISSNAAVAPDRVITIFNWTKEATEILIREYGLHKSQIDSGQVTKKTVWAAIVDILAQNGYNVTPMQCENKWKGLTKSYKAAAAARKSKTFRRFPFVVKYQKELDKVYGHHQVESNVQGSTASRNKSSSCHRHTAAPVLFASRISTGHPASGGQRRRATATADSMPDWLLQYNEIQERRHRERLKCMEKSMEIFRDVFTMAVDRLCKCE